MTKYTDIHQRVRNLLKGTEATYPNELILDGINSASKALLPWLPKKKVEYITVTSGSLIELPFDVYRVDAVYSEQDSFWLKKLSLTSGNAIASTYPMWMEYPSGFISLSLDTYEGVPLKVYYFSTWDEIVIEDFNASEEVLGTPAFADLAITYYACAYCLTSAATSTAQLRQFNTKIDSGNPEDNPLKEMSNLLMQRFMNEVKLFPTVDLAKQ